MNQVVSVELKTRQKLETRAKLADQVARISWQDKLDPRSSQ